jgi:Family of unknown function (DUF5947)
VSTTPDKASTFVLERLKSLREDRSKPRSGEVCELCGVAISEPHPHMVSIESRSLLCVCRPCYLLFTAPGAARGRYRAVPERCVFAPGLRLSEMQWESLQIPVNIAFIFHNSTLGKMVAFYPSPAGATESLLALETWEDVERANPILQGLEPDVEALLLYRRATGFDCYVTGIDACYELVGRIRRRWKGFDGGEEAWRDIDLFFEGLRARSTVARSTGAGEPWPS